MYIKKTFGPVEVELPDGRRLNRSDLPPTSTKRWGAKHKKVVVDAVVFGLIDYREAETRYGISVEELESWIRLAHNNGARALRATALKHYRQP